MSIQEWVLLIILILVAVGLITWFITLDARRRGFRGFQIPFLVFLAIFPFPLGLILYLIIRPPRKPYKEVGSL